MRIKCKNLQDFMENLKGATVYQGRVYVNRSRMPVGDNARSSTSFEVFFQASAVINFGDGGQALVESGQSCGIDRLTGDGGTEGSNIGQSLYRSLCEFCEEQGLSIMPGLLDF